jgi:hypothetical protein
MNARTFIRVELPEDLINIDYQVVSSRSHWPSKARDFVDSCDIGGVCNNRDVAIWVVNPHWDEHQVV